LFSTVLLLVPLVAVQQQAPAPFDASRQSWSVGLVTAGVPALPEGDWFGGPDWRASQVTFRTAENEGDVQVQVRQDEELEMKDVRLRVTSEGARVQIEHQSDIERRPLQDVGGVVCLVTNGTDARLEFELYEISGGYYVQALAGSVALRGAGRALALELAQRPANPGASTLQTLVRVTGQEDHSESHGYVDEFDRKQSLWALSEPSGRRMELGWRDGIPHGTALGWDEKGRLRTLRGFRDGLQDGENMDWTEEGQLRSHDSFAFGRANGRRLVFHPNGAKALEMEFVNNRQVGTRKHWSEAGELIGEDPPQGPQTFRLAPTADEVNAESARLQARFDSLHTHAKR